MRKRVHIKKENKLQNLPSNADTTTANAFFRNTQDTMRLFFRKSQRVVHQRDFSMVLSRKCCASKGLMRLYAAPNGLDYPRLGVSISRKCGPAVVRNRLKRLARQAFRLNQHDLPLGYDYILILTAAKPIKKGESITNIDFETFESRFLQLVKAVSDKPCFRQ